MNRSRTSLVLLMAVAAATLWVVPLSAQQRHGSRSARPVAVADRSPAADMAAGRAVAGPATAGDSASPAGVGARSALNRQRELGLTPDQARLLDAIARRYDDQDKLLRDDKARAASRAAERREVSAILNPDQLARAAKP